MAGCSGELVKSGESMLAIVFELKPMSSVEFYGITDLSTECVPQCTGQEGLKCMGWSAKSGYFCSRKVRFCSKFFVEMVTNVMLSVRV